MRVGVVFPQTEIGSDPIAVRDYAQTAEGLDCSHILAFDHVLGANRANRPDFRGPYDHNSLFHEPFVLFGYLAGLTERIGLTTGIIIVAQRQTALVAKQAAAVDVLSGGRLRLGIGIGWNNVEFEGLGENFRDRGRRSEEQVAVMRALWTQETVTYEGKWHKITEAGINPLPIQRPIPIWMGAGAPGMPVGPNRVLQRVGRLADGYFPLCEAGETAQTLIETVKRYAQEAGRNPDDLKIEGRIELTGTQEDWQAQVAAWENLGADAVSVGTARAPFNTPDEHIQAIKTFKDII